MTNEQLKIILHNHALLLRQAIEKADDLMPDNAKRELEWHYIGKETGLARSATAFNCATVGFENSKYYEQRPTGQYIALKPLYDHIDLLERHIEMLSKES